MNQSLEDILSDLETMVKSPPTEKSPKKTPGIEPLRSEETQQNQAGIKTEGGSSQVLDDYKIPKNMDIVKQPNKIGNLQNHQKIHSNIIPPHVGIFGPQSHTTAGPQKSNAKQLQQRNVDPYPLPRNPRNKKALQQKIKALKAELEELNQAGPSSVPVCVASHPAKLMPTTGTSSGQCVPFPPTSHPSASYPPLPTKQQLLTSHPSASYPLLPTTVSGFPHPSGPQLTATPFVQPVHGTYSQTGPALTATSNPHKATKKHNKTKLPIKTPKPRLTNAPFLNMGPPLTSLLITCKEFTHENKKNMEDTFAIRDGPDQITQKSGNKEQLFIVKTVNQESLAATIKKITEAEFLGSPVTARLFVSKYPHRVPEITLYSDNWDSK